MTETEYVDHGMGCNSCDALRPVHPTTGYCAECQAEIEPPRRPRRHTYRVTLPDGETATRTTARTYSHVVAATEGPDLLAARRAEYEARAAEGQAWYAEQLPLLGTWGAHSWAGRLDLAEKEAARWTKAGYEVRILPVENPRGAGTPVSASNPVARNLGRILG